jgi:hypothetical protein
MGKRFQSAAMVRANLSLTPIAEHSRRAPLRAIIAVEFSGGNFGAR